MEDWAKAALRDQQTPWLRPFDSLPYRIESFPASANPDLQTAETIGAMCRHTAGSANDPALARAAHDASADLPGLKPSERASRTFQWVQSHVDFRNDPPDDELLIAPPALLAMPHPAGDCDDFAMLTAAMLASVNVPATFVTIAADPSDPLKFSHVYVEAQTERGPLALDTSHGAYPGWHAGLHSPVWRLKRWPMLLSQTTRKPATLNGLCTVTPRRRRGVRGLGFDWDIFSNVVKTGTEATTDILSLPVFTPPGTVVTTPGGSIIRQQPGSFAPLPFSASLGIGSGTILLVGLGVLAIVLLAGARR